MSKPVAAEWRETAEELRERYVTERDVGRRKRLQALWLVRRGEPPRVSWGLVLLGTGQQGCGRLVNEGGLELGGRDHAQRPV